MILNFAQIEPRGILQVLQIMNKILPKWFNPLMPKRVLLCLCLVLVFNKQMLQAANADLFNPLVLKAHNSKCQNLLFPLQIKPVKVS